MRTQSGLRMSRVIEFGIAVMALLIAVSDAVHANDGSIVAWGRNRFGECNVPTPNNGFMSIAGGGEHSLGLKSDGSIVAWGRNNYGQCNVPDPNSRYVAIAGGEEHSLGLKDDGSIVAWGAGRRDGQSSHPHHGQCNVPEPNTDFVAVAGGYWHSLGLKQDGTIAAWGYNACSQCNVPAPNTGFVSIAGGGQHSLGLKSDGSIVAWGWNGYDLCDVPTPNTGFVSVAAGSWHSLGLKDDGSIVAWGRNTFGECDVPAPNTGFVAIAACELHSLALKEDGSIVTWGDNDVGQCSVPEPNNGFVAVAGGYWHSLGLKPIPPFLELDAPTSNITINQSESVSIGWQDDGQIGAEIRLYFDPDTGAEPWNEGGGNEIRIPITRSASNSIDELTWPIANLAPGTYSIWGESDNNFHAPAYSRAPGLVMVTEYTEDTEPEIDQDRLDINGLPSPVFLRQASQPTNLYLVTHGWNGLLGGFADHEWIVDVTEYVDEHLGSATDWDVAYLDWSAVASGPIAGPDQAVSNAMAIGVALGDEIVAAGYDHVEIVGHSAGAWMAHKIAAQLEPQANVFVQLTLLDAFVNPPELRSSLGSAADHVSQFFDATPAVPYKLGTSNPLIYWMPTPCTQEVVSHAFNVDISCRFDDIILAPDAIPGSDHTVPRKWYRASAALADGQFMDDATYSHGGQVAPLGFKMSKAYTPDDHEDWDLSRYPNDGALHELNCGGGKRDGECTGNTTVFVEYDDVFDFTAMTSAVGADGTVVIAADNVVLRTGTESAWVGFDVPINRAITSVIFDVEFISMDLDAEGYATAYWHGLQLSSADERFMDESDPGVRSFMFYETVAPGEKVISFRLDNNGGPTSSVRISNLRTGIYLNLDLNDDCVADAVDFCTWIAAPFDLDGDGVIDAYDQTMLATALGVSEEDLNGNGIPDICQGDCPWDTAPEPPEGPDGTVGLGDLNALLSNWGACPPPPDDCPWDFAPEGGDGTVGLGDLNALLSNWGPCP
jgi:hypothetical protein